MPDYPIIRVTKLEIQILIHLYGWNGVFTHLKKIVAERGILWAPGRSTKIIRCVKTWWENDSLCHQNYDVIVGHNCYYINVQK
jgi:hypothetical protein